MIQDVKSRMEAIYGPSERHNHSAHRSQSITTSNDTFRTLCATHELSLFDLPKPQLPRPVSRKRKRRNRSVKEETRGSGEEDEEEQEEEDEADEDQEEDE